MLNFFLYKFGEYTTWVAILGVPIAFNIFSLTPGQIAAIATLGVALFAVPEKKLVAKYTSKDN